MGEHNSLLFLVVTLVIDHYNAIIPPFHVVFFESKVEKSLVPDVISPEPVNGF